jgi:tryptophan-rich sensory protein
MNEIASKGQLHWSFARVAFVAVPLVLVLGTLSGRAAGSSENNPWFEALVKPEAYPPGEVFGIAWTILYVMMGLAVALVWSARGARGRGQGLALFAIQLAANLAWSPLFFRLHNIEGAFWLVVGIFVLALATTLRFGSIRRMAGWLMVPYLAWLVFAGVLNWRIAELNPNGGPDVTKAGIEMRLPAQQE